eukprot:CAMPEP_0170233906 /NCGR_PEP_ID=MMETSP0116_2-20130129/16699_1 /TAXON_ID=400756 /ORGANISM="Durinskia baltica, Strain CSIRO CS-38" /LENGTH=84 /DNA_ID=CAMNT_0010484701 /DNA_START=75 /DNA_END=326 /DNA_ORIENTATION=+
MKSAALLSIALVMSVYAASDCLDCPNTEGEPCGASPDGDDTGLLQLAHPHNHQCRRAGEFCGKRGFVTKTCCGQLECKQLMGGS